MVKSTLKNSSKHRDISKSNFWATNTVTSFTSVNATAPSNVAKKLVEEAPPLHNDDTARNGARCRQLAESVKYEGAGTVEFLVDEKGNYAVEMNTRIQVEHGVTEVTGIDLVEQLLIASGKKLSYEQKDVKILRRTIECRVCAEDRHATLRTIRKY